MSLSAAKLALAVERARLQSGAPEVLNSEPIAVVGLGCRFPGGVDSPEAFWRLLHNGMDGIVDLPRDRWPATPYLPPCQGGFLSQVDGFDAEFFGIPPREAERLDPQHRLLMEVAWESLWDAGYTPEMLAGGSHGVFVAVYNNDYFRLQFGHPEQINAYTSTGTSHSAAVGRISFLLDWKGPSVAVDTACSSSLVAVHLACQSLRAHECRMALAGGVSLILAPEELISLNRLGMLAADGRCKTFDSRADGFVPGEGCGIAVLKRLSDALRDGDTIRAVIRGSAVNQDGRSTVLTAPNGLSQQAVIRAALANARISGPEIGYVEAHGTGTALGDPIEVEALAAVLGEGAERCAIGSAKTNFGHLEAAAGIAGLMKVVLALEHGEIPRILHFRQLNPEIRLEGARLMVADRSLPWTRGPLPRFAGVSSFGFGGTNAHVVLEEAPGYSATGRAPVERRPWQRQRFWFKGPQKLADRPVVHALLGARLTSPALRETVFENSLGAEFPEFLGDHQVGEEVLLPLAASLEMFLAASGADALEEVMVQEALKLPARGTKRVQVTAGAETLRLFCQEAETWKLHVTGRTAAPAPVPLPVALEELRRGMAPQPDIEGFYKGLEARGLLFGPSFRRIEELWRCEGGALARVRTAGPEGCYRIHPAVLDGCFQVLGALLPDDGTYLPLGLKRFQLFGSPGGDLWSYATLRAGTGSALTGNIRIFNSQGYPVAVAEGMWLRKSTPRQSQECLCQIEWQSRPRNAVEKRITGGAWLIFADAGGIAAGIAGALEADGAICTLISRGEPFEPMLADPLLRGIVHLWALDSPPTEQLTGATLGHEEQTLCGSVLQVIRNLAAKEYRERPHIWVVTRGAQMAGAGRQHAAPAQAPLWGLARTLRHEHPDLHCVTIDLDPDMPSGAQVLEEIRYPDREQQIAWRSDSRLAPRLVSVAEKSECVRLEAVAKGRLEEIRWLPASRRDPGPGEVEIRVEAAGLNFRDVLNALGEYPGEAGPLGSECAGRIARLGAGVAGFAPGDEVVAVAQGSFADYVTARADMVIRKPAALSMETAAGIPVAFVTARLALETIGGIKARDRVLIHAAAGGVGLAAVAEAQRVGAEIFATAGSDEKRAYLRSLGIRHIFSSRTLEYGSEISHRTGGAGVELVLNCLSNDHIRESLQALAPGGTFLELGRKGIWDRERASALRPDVKYFVVDWVEEEARQPGLIANIFRSVIHDAGQGSLKPVSVRTFSGADVVNAFRWMAQARHIGKIAVRLSGAGKSVRPDGSYLITGGLGALGLHVASWMASHGAGRLVLFGRSAPSDAANRAIEAMEQSGAEVVVRHGDAGQKEDLERVVAEIGRTGKPLKGVVHAAGVLDDGVLSAQTWERFARVMAPKTQGAWHLHQLTAGLELDFFVLFSSLASILGSPGQGGYSAANAFLDELAHYRHTLGLPAVSVNWGPWEAAGMAASPQAGGWQRSFPGIRQLPIEDGLKLWERILHDNDSNQLAAFLIGPGVSIPGLEAGVQGDRVKDRQPGEMGDKFRSRTGAAGLSAGELILFLQEEVTKIMGIEDSRLVDAQQPLFDAGLDSLMAVEFRNVLASAFDRVLPSTLLFDYPTLHKLAVFLKGSGSRQNPPEHKPEHKPENNRLAREIQDLEESAAEFLLQAELDREN